MTPLQRATQILEDAMRIPPDLARLSTADLYGRLLGAVAEARNQLYSVRDPGLCVGCGEREAVLEIAIGRVCARCAAAALGIEREEATR